MKHRTSMRDRLVLLSLAAIVVAAVAAPASARRAPMPAPPAPAPLEKPGAIAPARDSSDGGELLLRRAAAEQRLGHTRGVVEMLEPLDFATPPRFAGADRAAFLLGHAYLELGSRERFERLAHAVGRWNRGGPWTEWLAYQLRLVEAETDASAALARLADSGPGASPALERLARVTPVDSSAHGANAIATADLDALSAADTTTALGRDLAGAALIRRATAALERGEDARPLLAQMPARSRYSLRARHLYGLIDLERGDIEHGRQTLGALLADDWSYPGQRAVLTALAGQAMDAGQWAAARDLYERADHDWSQEADTMRTMIRDLAYDRLWAQWESGAAPSDALVIDGTPSRAWTDRLTAAAADLNAAPESTALVLDAPEPSTGARWPLPPPPPADWSAIAAAANRLGEASDALDRADAAVAAVRREVAEHSHYLTYGFDQTHHEQQQLEARAAHLDSLRQQLDAVDHQLRTLRDQSTRHVLARASEILGRTADQLRWMHAMRHFNIDGPLPKRPLDVPAGYPSPDSLLAAEEALAHVVATAAESLAAQAPALIARSYAEAWRPGIIDRAASQDLAAARALAWAKRLAASIDSSLAVVTPDSLRALELRAAARAKAADSLQVAWATLRTRVAHDAVERALATLDTEREGLDYGLAASAYGLSVGFDRADSSLAAAADTADVATETPEARRWRAAAIGAIDSFLVAHPRSFARGEMRFRLADLDMVDARAAFRTRMAQFVKAQAAPNAPPMAVPTLDAGPALALYRTILAEDHDFPHLDAVMFNAGMILADAADPEATPMFQRLVASYPQSRYCQEAYVRMGDVGFADHRYAECIPYYEHAAEGADTTLRAISLYKLGWSRFSLDRFMDAADAFRSILDLYAAGGHVDSRVNLADEAEAYLVHTLARAGGAGVAGAYFDKIGPRPYETRLLRAMAQHFRRYSLYAEATAADRLVIQRHPTDPDALLSAQRMIETFQRWDRPALEQAARLELAPRFAPGGDWYVAQQSDSAQAAGAAFARASWTSVARQHHKLARETGTSAEYQTALDLYETVLGKFPKDAEAPTLELNAGEASAQLGNYGRALRHYGAAAKTGPDSVVAIALWQRVAITDAWYQTAPAPTPGGAASPVSDSLARAVIRAADAVLDRFPAHPRAADLMWRQANLAFAHGWYEQSASYFGRLADQRPDDRRAPAAANLRADAIFRLGHFGDAGAAYEQALVIAKKAGADSLARRAEAAIPVSYYRQAEAAVAADSTGYDRHADLFAKVADGWPRYEHADLARYRAGLAYAKGGHTREAIRSMRALVNEHPKSELLRDAHLEMATLAESDGQNDEAGRAYAEFAARFPADSQSGAAMLKAADLFAKSGQLAHADTLRLDYMQRHPEDVETAMALLEEMARREIATVNAAHPISTLLPAAAPAPARRGKTGTKRIAPKTAPASRLADYLALADNHPKLASHALIAQVRFLQGEEANASYAAATLSQPLNRSIPAKQKLLDATLARYRQSVDLGDSEWGHASTFRIGEALVGFGDALVQSERPADLKGDDIVAYNEVLSTQARVFFTKGEDVWAELLKQKQREVPDETWIQQAQTSLWHRLGGRFHFRPEAEVPLVEGDAPARDSGDARAQEEDGK